MLMHPAQKALGLLLEYFPDKKKDIIFRTP